MNHHHALLVFPITNKKIPLSLWSCFFPRTKMVWEWDDEGDSRVADLWHLREKLSSSGKVVYAKWYQGRATLFSKKLFVGLLAAMESSDSPLSAEAARMHRLLVDNSPLSTKELKQELSLKGATNEKEYNRALKELWTKFLVVGFGEKDDGAFPSLAIAATQVVFEEEWREASKMSRQEGLHRVSKYLPKQSPFLLHFLKIYTSIQRVNSVRNQKATSPKNLPKVITFEQLESERPSKIS